MAVIGGIDPFDVDQMMELDMEVHHNDAAQPIAALSTMADSLPGLGIVAAVLGVVITMGALGGPPEEIGQKVAAALVGTFLGILLCYGLVGPVAANMGKTAEDEHAYEGVLRVAMIAFMKGTAPIMAVEIARRAHSRALAPELPGIGNGLPQEWRAPHPLLLRRHRQNSSEGADVNGTRPIIIKRVKGHGGHHGGAWKVAYADFVTAMMALFIVLWLLNSSKQVQEAVGGYFKDPMGTSKKVGSNQTGSGENFTLKKDDMPKLKEQLQIAMHKMNDFEKLKNQIEMTVTSEGLRIELLETDTGVFFDTGKPEPNSAGKELADHARSRTRQDAQPHLHRGTHRLAPLHRRRRIRQLGTLVRSRQRRSKDHAT